MLQTVPHGFQSFSRGAIKGEGLHGNSLIIRWDHFLRMRSVGCPQPAEGQSHDCIHCPVLGHSSTARSQAGKSSPHRRPSWVSSQHLPL